MMSSKRFLDKLKSEKAYILGIPISMHYFLLFVLVGVILYGVRNWVNQDKWNTLVHEQYQFTVDYPANWTQNTFGERGSHNLLDQKAHMWTNILGFLGPTSKGLRVYWTQMEGATLSQAAEWGLEKSTQRYGPFSELQEIQVGDNYPALTRTFQPTNNSQIRIHYYIVRNDNIYLLEFYLRNKNKRDDATLTFNHMLSSFLITD